MGFLDVTIALCYGFIASLAIFVITLLFGAPLGLPIAFCSMSKLKIVRTISKTFVWIIRGVPLMLQIFMIYYLPGLLSEESNIWRDLSMSMTQSLGGQTYVAFGEFVAVLIAFIITYACYFSEIYRGGIESISQGQYEAGYVLGLSKSQVFRKIILKQVIKRIVPPMSNEIITLIKDTALANCISVAEIIFVANNTNSAYQIVWPIFYAGVFYLIFVGLLTIILGKVEKKLDYFKS